MLAPASSSSNLIKLSSFLPTYFYSLSTNKPFTPAPSSDPDFEQFTSPFHLISSAESNYTSLCHFGSKFRYLTSCYETAVNDIPIIRDILCVPHKTESRLNLLALGTNNNLQAFEFFIVARLRLMNIHRNMGLAILGASDSSSSRIKNVCRNLTSQLEVLRSGLAKFKTQTVLLASTNCEVEVLVEILVLTLLLENVEYFNSVKSFKSLVGKLKLLGETTSSQESKLFRWFGRIVVGLGDKMAVVFDQGGGEGRVRSKAHLKVGFEPYVR